MALPARTHAGWDGPDIAFEDLLVSVADKVWKAFQAGHPITA